MIEESGIRREPLSKEEFLARHPWARKGVCILQETDEWVAVGKPPGWLSIPDRWNPDFPNLLKFLRKRYNHTQVYPVHRLDWEASGVNLFARTLRAHKVLNVAFQYRAVRKVYLALVEGIPESSEGEIDARLAPISARKRNVYRVNQVDGKPALTRYRVLKTYLGYSLLQVEPITGRTHQIRVHLKTAVAPIAGDVSYAGHWIYASRLKHGTWKAKEERPLLERAFLHSWMLDFPDPLNIQKRHQVFAPLPRDLRAVLRFLEQYRNPHRSSGGMVHSEDVDQLIWHLQEEARKYPLVHPRPLQYSPVDVESSSSP